MKWKFAHCSICGRDKFKENEVQAFRIKRHEDSITIEPIQLNGRAPWSGITCICKKCLEVWKKYHLAGESDDGNETNIT